MISRIKKIDTRAGQKPHTAQYGATIVFTTEENEKLYWDTNSRKFLDYLGEDNVSFEISYKVIEVYGNNSKEISHVRLRV